MKVDIGFFDINGNYIEDIQELNEIERKEIMETKNFDEFFDELNDMANFKNFGEKKEGITNADGSRNWQANILLDNVKRLEQENAELRSTLQEIKAIAKAPKPFIDFSVTKTATEVGYDYAAICKELELRLHKVLGLITKAEEE